MKGLTPRFFWYWFPAILWPVAFRLAIYLFLSNTTPSWAVGKDKLMHLLYYGIMAFLFWRGFRFERRMEPWPAALAAFGVIAVYGGIDELSQQFRPHRSADIRDWFADLAGGALPFVAAAAETFARRRLDAIPVACPET